MILSDCPVIQVMKQLKLYEYNRISADHAEYKFACGCIVSHWYDDTPGWRENEWYYNCKNCVLGYKPCKIDDANR